jgi:hypothetical protein
MTKNNLFTPTESVVAHRVKLKDLPGIENDFSKIKSEVL